VDWSSAGFSAALSVVGFGASGVSTAADFFVASTGVLSVFGSALLASSTGSFAFEMETVLSDGLAASAALEIAIV
jgi:hypothetical protein